MFESRDVVSGLYLERHSRVLSAAKASEITSCLVQGRQFFTAAELAGELARPLLLYYGVLALSRGLILFMNKSLRLCSLDPSHGLEENGWSRLLLSYGGGAKHIPDLEIVIRGSGTFAEIASVTRNSERWRVFSRGYHPEFFGLTPGNIAAEPTVVNVMEIIERIPDLSVLHEKAFGSASRCHPAFIEVQDIGTGTHVEVLETEFGLLGEIQLPSLLSLPEGTPITVSEVSIATARHMQRQGESPIDVEAASATLPHTSVEELLHHLSLVKNDRSGKIYLVSALPNGTLLSKMSLLYILSYVMGMLVRYYPSAWQSLVARESGDITFPLLRAAMALIRDQFPELIVNELEDVHPKFPRAH